MGSTSYLILLSLRLGGEKMISLGWGDRTMFQMWVVLLVLCYLFTKWWSVEAFNLEDDERAAAHLFNKKTKRLLLKLFRRRIKIPEHSSLSLSTQVSRPNFFPGLFKQEDGIITDAVVEAPCWGKYISNL